MRVEKYSLRGMRMSLSGIDRICLSRRSMFNLEFDASRSAGKGCNSANGRTSPFQTQRKQQRELRDGRM